MFALPGVVLAALVLLAPLSRPRSIPVPPQYENTSLIAAFSKPTALKTSNFVTPSSKTVSETTFYRTFSSIARSPITDTQVYTAAALDTVATPATMREPPASAVQEQDASASIIAVEEDSRSKKCIAKPATNYLWPDLRIGRFKFKTARNHLRRMIQKPEKVAKLCTPRGARGVKSRRSGPGPVSHASPPPRKSRLHRLFEAFRIVAHRLHRRGPFKRSTDKPRLQVDQNGNIVDTNTTVPPYGDSTLAPDAGITRCPSGYRAAQKLRDPKHDPNWDPRYMP